MTDRFLATSEQARLGFFQRLTPDGTAYVEQIAFDVAGRLDQAHLAEGLRFVVRRHPVLASRFEFDGDELFQSIPAAADVPLHWLRAADYPELVTDKQFDWVAWGFEQLLPGAVSIESGPLTQVLVLEFDPERFIVLIGIHQLITDRLGKQLFLDELAAAYNSFRDFGTPPRLPMLSHGFADFSAQQIAYLNSNGYDSDLAFWKQQLEALVPLELPLDRPRPVRLQTGGHHNVADVGVPLESIHIFCQQHRITPYILYLSAVTLLLMRYTGQADHAVATLATNRDALHWRPVIGCFINTQITRLRASPETTGIDLLASAANTVWQGLEHRRLPFNEVIQQLEPNRQLNKMPISPVFFSMQPGGDLRLSLSGTTSSSLDEPPAFSGFDLDLRVAERGSALQLTVNFAADIFESDTITRLAGHFGTLLASLMAAPDQPIGDLPILSPAEAQRMLKTWNQTQMPLPVELGLNALFKARVQARPHKVAITYENLAGEKSSWTYKVLDERANQVSHLLLAYGVGPGDKVGLFLNRRPELLAAILGTIKAGAAYVPFDPDYPKSYLEFTLDDSGAKLLLTDAALADRVPPGHPAALLSDSLSQPRTDIEHAAVLDAAALPAYVIYTSGSTGKPKGVAIAQRSVANLVTYWGREFTPANLERVLFWTTISFDGSVFEIFVPLLMGGGMVLVESIFDLPELTVSDEVTLINAVPSAMLMLSEIGGMPRNLQAVTMGGESFPEGLAESLYLMPAMETIFNVYGPTEATVHSTTYRYPKQGAGPAYIGRPIANFEAYILDDRRKPVPIGVTGELYLGGIGLSTGYVKRPELTAEKFVAHPFATGEPRAGLRLYNTGDLVRYRPDGQIEFLGRKDQQVKVRGFRIELGQVESALREHPQVQEAVVAAVGQDVIDRYLVAHVVSEGQSSLSAAALKRHLLDIVPDYMVPSLFNFLDVFPLTANGKIDRAALPAVSRSIDSGQAGFDPPKTEMEERLASIWKQVIPVDRIDRQDDFFEIGGHSLNALQLVHLISADLKLSLPPLAIFEHPTLASQARLLEQE
jgi:amino acid adenylation domain-containing protein